MNLKYHIKLTLLQTIEKYLHESTFSTRCYISPYHLFNFHSRSYDSVTYNYSHDRAYLFSYLLSKLNNVKIVNSDINYKKEFKLIESYKEIEDILAVYLFTGIPIEDWFTLPLIVPDEEEHSNADDLEVEDIDYVLHKAPVKLTELNKLSLYYYTQKASVPNIVHKLLTYIINNSYSRSTNWYTSKLPEKAILEHEFRTYPVALNRFDVSKVKPISKKDFTGYLFDSL